MIPIARTEKLLIQAIGDELIVYDQENNASHCLNKMAVRIWEVCDGQNTVNDIAKLLEKELDIPADSDVDIRGLVWLTLEELERYNLIKEYRKEPIAAVPSISRRNVIKTATLVGGFAIGSMFPLVKSIVAPEPAIAKSPKTKPRCEIIKGAICSLTWGAGPSCIDKDDSCKKAGGVCKTKPEGTPNNCECVKNSDCTFPE